MHLRIFLDVILPKIKYCYSKSKKNAEDALYVIDLKEKYSQFF